MRDDTVIVDMVDKKDGRAAYRRASSYGAPLLLESKFCRLTRSKFSISSFDDDTAVLSNSGFMMLLINHLVLFVVCSCCGA